VILLLIALLASCAPAASGMPAINDPGRLAASSTKPLTPTPLVPPAPSPVVTPRPPVMRVVIISIDGLHPDEIELAPMPVLQELMRTGAYSLTAQTVLPTVTLPDHSSMLSGLCPSAHGVTWDTYLPENGYAVGTDLFDLAHARGLRTIMVVGKDKLQQITEPSSLDVFQWVNDPDPVVARRAVELIRQGFSVLFVHFPDADLAGHAYGWLSTMQLAALRHTDEALQILLDGLGAASMRDGTLVIVTADHGGHETTHGYNVPADMTIPWIMDGLGSSRPCYQAPSTPPTRLRQRPGPWGCHCHPSGVGIPCLKLLGCLIRPRVRNPAAHRTKNPAAPLDFSWGS